ncbi:MAG: CoA synthetase [Gammaproteobacteria bacterium]|nr:CoA synthetase [Gammaproteobacteria bacterium]
MSASTDGERQGARCRPQEALIYAIAGLLAGVEHVTTGMASPIPACAALLRRELDGAGRTRVSILKSRRLHAFTDGGAEIFDLAAQGRIGAFFLSGGQIDGAGNINLIGVSEYPCMDVRWSGAFGSAYLYYLVPRVILFRFEHTPRTLVERVDFVAAPGRTPANVYRRGGPYALITDRCLFMFDRPRGRFRLESVHPGHNVAEIHANTGFAFDVPAEVPVTGTPSAEVLEIIRTRVAAQIADPYPRFAAEVFAS